MRKNTVHYRKRFNITDVVITVTVILLVTVLVKMFIGNSNINIPPVSKLEYTILVENLNADIANKFSKGQKVIDNDSGNTIGTISAVSKINSDYYEYNNVSGEHKKYVYPDLFDVRIKVICSYSRNDADYITNDVIIKQGKAVSFRTDKAYAQGCIESFETVTADILNTYGTEAEDSLKEVTADGN